MNQPWIYFEGKVVIVARGRQSRQALVDQVQEMLRLLGKFKTLGHLPLGLLHQLGQDQTSSNKTDHQCLFGP